MSADKKSTFFVSYAHEDRETVAKPLSEELSKRGYKVWFDGGEIDLGASVRAQIDHGLQSCDFGIVILSEAYLSKGWTQAELDALATRQANEMRTVILPVWHDVGAKQVADFSPMLASRLGVRFSLGLHEVVRRIIKAAERSSSSESGTNGPAVYSFASRQPFWSEVESYVESFVGLVASPKRWLRVNAIDTGDSARRSLKFFGFCFLLYTLVTVAYLPKDICIFQRLGSRAVSTLFSAIAVTALSKLSFRCVGGVGGFRGFWERNLYVQGVFALLFAGLLLLTLGVAQSLDPGVQGAFQRIIWVIPEPGDQILLEQAASHPTPQLLGSFALFLVALGAPWLWVFASWGTYREIAKVGKWRSSLAFVIFILLVAVWMLVNTQISKGLNPACSTRGGSLNEGQNAAPMGDEREPREARRVNR